MAGLDEYVKLLLHGNGVDGSTTIVDSSSVPKTVSTIGNTQIDTEQYKFGGASILFDGSGDGLYCVDSADWDLGSDSFTIDAWVRWASFPSTPTVICQHYESASKYYTFQVYTTYGDRKLLIYFYDGGPYLGLSSSALTLTTNTWYHVAVVKNGTSVKLYLNGTEVGSTTYGTLPTFNGNLYIGIEGSGSYSFNGWIDELRFSKGVARWTSNFTPASDEYSADIVGENDESFSVDDYLDAIGVDNFDESFSANDIVVGSVLHDIATDGDSFSLDDSLQAGFDHQGQDNESFTVSSTLTLEYSLGSTESESFGLNDIFSALYADVIASSSVTFPKMSNISRWGVNLRGTATFPKFSGISRQGIVLVGNAVFPKMSNRSYRGNLALTQAVPKLNVSGVMTIRSSRFTNLGVFPKMVGSSVMRSGLIMRGANTFPKMSTNSGNIVDIRMNSAGVFPRMSNRSILRAAGRFTGYILRYIR